MTFSFVDDWDGILMIVCEVVKFIEGLWIFEIVIKLWNYTFKYWSCEIEKSWSKMLKLWSCEVLKFWNYDEVVKKLWSFELWDCDIMKSWIRIRIINDINLLQKLMSWRHNWNNVVFFTLIRILIGPNTPVHHNLAQNN